jgi:uncharacterized protein (DUF1800 family)
MLPQEIAVNRFGLGARPGELRAAAGDPRGWLTLQTRGAAPAAGGTPLVASDQIIADLQTARREARERARAAPPDEPTTATKLLRKAYLPHYRAQVLARARSAALTERPFTERLVHFWCNHFAVSADKGAVSGLAGTIETEAVRPWVNGRFLDLLTAVERHPAMILFLDNQHSIGPNSIAARRAEWRDADPGARRPGLNENLAREILELHTLGVDGGYSQQDVTSFARIITGWSVGGGAGRLAGGEPGRFAFRENMHEPGPQVFLGRRYSEAGAAQGEAVLADLARHPSTARFIAAKLVRHFVADDAPAAAVDRVAHEFLRSDGDLPHVYRALIASADAWQPSPRKFKTPEDFVFSTLRALDAAPPEAAEVIRSFEFLGQRQYAPGSPAGWPDTAGAWDGADALMHRVLWAARVSERFDRGLDPVELADSCLGSCARPETLEALRRAASGAQGLALLLMSPEFQRR